MKKRCKINQKNNTNTNYFKKIIEPTDEELKKHKEYLKNNLKKNFF
jgi:DNA polymerase-3 subunit epsilon